jgi:nucleoside-diphosphate-sugar epimerase
LRDLDIMIHLAQRAHLPPSRSVLEDEPQAAAALARAAALSGVRRFLYISSIKAMGETTAPERPFRPTDIPRPEDAYGRAKLATERALAAAAAETGLELAILRPPLVYGPGVGGNFRALLRLARSGLPLPFAGLDNRRSLIARDNLVDLIAACCTHQAAIPAGREVILLARDGTDLSTPELVCILAAAQGRNARLFAVPEPVLAGLRRAPRLGAAVRRLTLSLQIDDSATRAALGWLPSVAAETALTETARASAVRTVAE